MMRTAQFLVLLVVLGAGCSRKPSIQFGAVEGETIHETTKIEYRLRNSYGYRLSFPRSIGVVRLKEEFLLPSAANWGEKSSPDPLITHIDQERSSDGSSMMQEVEFDTDLGDAFVRAYEIIQGDPKGLHKIKLWVNGQEFKTIEFNVE